MSRLSILLILLATLSLGCKNSPSTSCAGGSCQLGPSPEVTEADVSYRGFDAGAPATAPSYGGSGSR